MLLVLVVGCGDDLAVAEVPDASAPMDAPRFGCFTTVQPSLVGAGSFGPVELAVDADHVYWAEEFGAHEGGGTLYRVAKAGGVITTLYAVADAFDFRIRGLTYHDGALFWVDERYEPAVARYVERLRTMPAAGGSVSDVLTASQIKFVVEDGYTYVTHHVADRTVVERIPHGGSPEPLGSVPGRGNALVADATDLYGMTYSESMWRMPKAGGDAIVLASGDFYGPRLLLDADHVYRHDANTGALTRVPKTGGAATPIELSYEAPRWGTALLDGDAFYLSGDDWIVRVAKTGGDFAPVVCPARNFVIEGMAVDGARLYFAASRKDGVFGVWAIDR